MRYRALRLPGPQAGRHHRDVRRAGDSTHVASLALDLRLPQCHSLKEKRAVVKTVLQGAARRYSVAASEVGHHDKWQRAMLGFATVAGSESHVREVLDAVERYVWSFPEVEVVSVSLDWMESDI